MILTVEQFLQRLRTIDESTPPFGAYAEGALRAHDAALRRQVEELTRERDAAEERADEQRRRAKRAEAEVTQLRAKGKPDGE